MTPNEKDRTRKTQTNPLFRNVEYSVPSPSISLSGLLQLDARLRTVALSSRKSLFSIFKKHPYII